MTKKGNLTRTQIIQYFIDKYKFKSYLEIGVQNGVNFNSITCEKKVGVDPDVTVKNALHLTSDDFFTNNKDKFDIIFIDGLHYADQVYRDITNSLAILNLFGVIICHDMLPDSYESQLVPRQTKVWYGNCWEAFVRLREREDVETRTVDTDCGCGIIRKQKPSQEFILRVDPLTYENFVENRNRWMNVITEEEFFKLY